MNMKKKAILILMVLPMFFVQIAEAARTAKVLVENAKVFDKPQPNAAEIGQLKKDSSILVSNNQTNGFYKTKIPSGELGWISGVDVLAGDMVASSSSTSTEPNKNTKKTTDHSNRSRLILAGGINFLNNTGFPTVIPTTNSGTALAGTLELQVPMSSKFGLSGRVEYLTDSSSLTVAGATQTIKFMTIPVMVGFNYFPVVTESLKWGFGAYAGASLLTNLSVNKSTSTSNPEFTSTDFSGLINSQFTFQFSSSVGLLGEVGYRLHSASYPAFAPYGTTAFKPNFGGLVTRLGISISI